MTSLLDAEVAHSLASASNPVMLYIGVLGWLVVKVATDMSIRSQLCNSTVINATPLRLWKQQPPNKSCHSLPHLHQLLRIIRRRCVQLHTVCTLRAVHYDGRHGGCERVSHASPLPFVLNSIGEEGVGCGEACATIVVVGGVDGGQLGHSTLQHFRQRVVTHASDSAQLWTDDLHSSPVKAGEAERDEEDESKREPTAESALVGRSAAPLRYSTFADTVALDASEVEGEKRPLSLAARGALAGGWLLVVAFVALTGAWGVVAQLRS